MYQDWHLYAAAFYHCLLTYNVPCLRAVSMTLGACVRRIVAALLLEQSLLLLHCPFACCSPSLLIDPVLIYPMLVHPMLAHSYPPTAQSPTAVHSLHMQSVSSVPDYALLNDSLLISLCSCLIAQLLICSLRNQSPHSKTARS